MSTITVKVKNKPAVTLPAGSLALDLAQKLNLTAPAEALAVVVNGMAKDLNSPLKEGDEVSLLHFDEKGGKEVFWHTSAHVLAQAVLRLFPKAQPTIGPPIDEGFYYDFANLTISDTDFERIEKEMEEIVKANYRSQREVLPNKEAARKAFSSNKYKLELIEGFAEEGEITAYRQGEFFDLCRGPHLAALGKIKALKVLRTSGAYWRGDSKREMLTRIYAITFPDRKLLKEYLVRQEEAKKRDHKILGPHLDLFSLREEAPGIPFIHPKGMIIWNALLAYWRECHSAANYIEIKTPLLMTKELWERSGHWAHYRHNMYTTTIEEREFAIKPMNCPGCMLFYKTATKSYREFPLRIAEIGHVHRFESSGSLSGLMRVRSFHQDDAHIFMEKEQIEEEILHVITLTERIFSTFGLTFELTLSTRPEKDTIGTDEEWEYTTAALRSALERAGKPFTVNEGDGAFYGPKIDLLINDALGRKWQCSTFQLDTLLPERFDLWYDAKDGSKKRPVMMHRALFGSIERFFGILIEHFAGKFPLWLSPRQIALIPVADRHLETIEPLAEQLRQEGFHVELFASSESVGKKIREAQLLQFNYMLTVGDKEAQTAAVSVRTRDNVVHGEIPFAHFLEKVKEEREKRSLNAAFGEAKG